jgi:hypothetical protein
VTTTLANPASAESLAKRAQCAARDPAHVAGDRLSIGAGRRAGILVDDRRRAPQAAGSGVGFTLLAFVDQPEDEKSNSGHRHHDDDDEEGG